MKLWPSLILLVAGCAAPGAQAPVRAIATLPPIEIQILAINDFHGSIQSSGPVTAIGSAGATTALLQGGAAQLGAALEKARHGFGITVAAGDLIGASPLESAFFLDEPTIDAMNLIGLDLAAVGNHEFDRGPRELWRMQAGGCARFVANRTPCRLEPFKGANFRYLAANVRKEDGETLFDPATVRQIGPVKIGFIGMTLRDTGSLVTPAGVAGLHFEDEATTANALVPRLKAAGADAIVLLIHQGGKVPETFRLDGCEGLSGAILPILDKLDPAIRIVVSGHTHHAYACEIERGGAKRLLTSAGKYGYFFTDIRLRFDPSTHALISESGVNAPVVSTGPQQADVAALVARYVAAARPAAERVVGHLADPARHGDDDRESPLGDLIADSQLAWTRPPARGGARIALVNSGGVRTDLVPRPDGSLTYGQIFAVQPFGNGLVVKTLTGAQLKSLLEQQFTNDMPGKVSASLEPSAGFAFRYDLARPVGQRIVAMTLGGKPIRAGQRYRVTVNNFLSSGGDGFTVLNAGIDPHDASAELDAMEAWLKTGPKIPELGRTRDVTRR
ncbi:MAG: bifunctional UDP-sugar hydrolase/5'-nucleotidase [Sphingomicrobium sp.]